MGTKKYILLAFGAILLFSIVAGGTYFFLADPLGLDLFKKEKTDDTAVETEPSVSESTGVAVSIPSAIESNKFGFLAGHFSADEPIVQSGAAWIRPHPGPFLWDSIQSKEGVEYNFQAADSIVESSQEFDFAILATVWPFAQWDQEDRADADDCMVPDTDHFLPGNDEKEEKFDEMKEKYGEKDDLMLPDSNYIPQHRCNPSDWDAYAEWLEAMVERYDGDGYEDMPGLEIPIKYWEVMNEPDLSWGQAGPMPDEEESLNFYMQDPEDYAELLINSYEAIKEADPEAEVLIAGAAGGNDEFLVFYRRVLDVEGAIEAFDIGNVHCISNDEYWNFNVRPYKALFDEYNISKPIWVTEAEAMVWDDVDSNASQFLQSTQNAIDLGAERIFYTTQKFEGGINMKPNVDPEAPELDVIIDGSDPMAAYAEIFERVGD